MVNWLNFGTAFLEPPGINILLLVLVLYLWMRSKKIRAALLLFINTVLLYSFSVSMVTDQLLALLEKKYQTATFEEIVKNKNPKAIVVLTAGKWPNANGLLRSQYAVKLAKATNLPILVSGGGGDTKSSSPDESEATGMAKSLATDFGVSGVIWVETDSSNTIENAKFTKKVLLEHNNIKDVFLITNAWHMPRAEGAFTKQGFNVVPVPVLSNLNNNMDTLENLTPKSTNIMKSSWFVHEYLGAYWYQLLDKFGKDA